MSLPSQEQNVVATHIYPVDDLGFTPVSGSDSHITLGISATANGTVFGTGVPATVVVLIKLSAGSGTLNVCLGADGFTPNYGSPTSTLTLSGTSLLATAFDTGFTFDDSSILTTTVSADTRFVGLQLAAGGSGMTVAQMAVLVLYELTAGEDWFASVRKSANAVANRTVGDGHGKVSLDPVLANSYVNANLKL